MVDAQSLIERYFRISDAQKFETLGSSKNSIVGNDESFNSSEILNKFQSYAQSNEKNNGLYIVISLIYVYMIIVKISMQKKESNNLPNDVDNKEEQYLITEIKLPKWIEINKNGKKTIVYIIEYTLKNKKCETKRSYSEFYKLFKKVSLNLLILH